MCACVGMESVDSLESMEKTKKNLRALCANGCVYIRTAVKIACSQNGSNKEFNLFCINNVKIDERITARSASPQS